MINIEQFIFAQILIASTILFWKFYMKTQRLESRVSSLINSVDRISFNMQESNKDLSSMIASDRKELLEIIRNTNQDVHERISKLQSPFSRPI